MKQPTREQLKQMTDGDLRSKMHDCLIMYEKAVKISHRDMERNAKALNSVYRDELRNRANVRYGWD